MSIAPSYVGVTDFAPCTRDVFSNTRNEIADIDSTHRHSLVANRLRSCVTWIGKNRLFSL